MVGLRALIVDDTADLRAVVRLQLELSGVEVVDEAADGWDGVTKAQLLQPDVVVLDLMMPELDGVSAIPQILAVAPGTRIVVYTSLRPAARACLDALDAGASAVVEKGDASLVPVVAGTS